MKFRAFSGYQIDFQRNDISMVLVLPGNSSETEQAVGGEESLGGC